MPRASEQHQLAHVIICLIRGHYVGTWNERRQGWLTNQNIAPLWWSSPVTIALFKRHYQERFATNSIIYIHISDVFSCHLR